MLIVVKRNIKIKNSLYTFLFFCGTQSWSFIVQLPYQRFIWLGNPGNYTHYTSWVLAMHIVVKRNTTIKIRTHFIHSCSFALNKAARSWSFIIQLPYQRCIWLGNPGNYTHYTFFKVHSYPRPNTAKLLPVDGCVHNYGFEHLKLIIIQFLGCRHEYPWFVQVYMEWNSAVFILAQTNTNLETEWVSCIFWGGCLFSTLAIMINTQRKQSVYHAVRWSRTYPDIGKLQHKMVVIQVRILGLM